MLHVVKVVTFLITVLVMQSEKAQNCLDKWFGEKCMYRCRCFGDVTCDNFGNCPKNLCVRSFFGPACQFLDSVTSRLGKGQSSYINDMNKTTCNPNAFATSVQVSTTAKYLFMWFRIEVKDTKNILNFTVQLNNNMQCSNQRIFPGNGYVDVTCDSNIALQALRITGPIAPDVCSIYVSIGRNVAVKQNATQVSTYVGALLSNASNAVDGNKNRDSSAGSCSHTAPKEYAWWRLSYNRPQILLVILITSRNVKQERLHGFALDTYDEKGKQIMHYIDKSVSYTTFDVPGCVEAVNEMVITSDYQDYEVDRVLSLCEVETFGETVCPESTYGLWCGEECQCKDNEICNPVTGMCAAGCKSGYYGYNCSSPCNFTCLAGLCTHREGKCLECIPGYLGVFCEIECAIGKFGDNCNKTCSSLCSGQDCNSTDGRCLLCDEDHSGSFCSEIITEDKFYERFTLFLLFVSGLTVAVCVGFLLLARKENDDSVEE